MPDHINACNCSLCTKTGARWGYFNPAQVTVTGTTMRYRRQDKPEPACDVHFCGICSATTHFTLTEGAVAKFGNTMMGVNMGLAGEAALAGIELRYPDGRSWSGAGDFAYAQPARVL